MSVHFCGNVSGGCVLFRAVAEACLITMVMSIISVEVSRVREIK